jgi:hypothetical protein
MAYKFKTCTGTVASVEDAYSALEELGSECREIVDNASEGLSQTQRIQTLSGTADALENLQCSDIPKCVRDLDISYSEGTNRNKRRGCSRAMRAQNAANVLEAAADACEAWLDEEADAHDDRDEVQALIDELREHADAATSAEFPGMYG